MFNGLIAPITNVVNQKQPMANIGRFTERRAALQDGLRYSTARNTLLSSLSKMAFTVNDIGDVRLMRKAVRRFGLNKPLMALVTPKGSGLRQAIPGLPSLESLDMVGVGRNDPRTKSTLAGLEQALDAEPDMIADWARTGADNAGALLNATADQIRDFGQAISYYLVVLEGRNEGDSDELVGSTLTAVPYDCTSSCIEALLDILPDLDAAVSNPTDRDAVDAQQAKLAAIVDKLGAHTGLEFANGNQHLIELGDAPESMAPKSDTFGSLGYNTGCVIELLKKADALLDEVNGLIERKETIVGNLNAAAAMVADVDNDVPPAVDDAITDDEDTLGAGEESLTEGMSQADLVHSHVSSHLCCIATVTDSAIKAVQNVLCVAEHVDTHKSAQPTPDPVD